jgi:hypothetical protein
MSYFDIILGFLIGGYFIALGVGVKGLKPEPVRGNKLLIVFGLVFIAGNIGITMLQRKMAAHKVTAQEFVDQERKTLNLPIQMDAVMRLETVSALAADKVAYNFSLQTATAADFDKNVNDQRTYYKAPCKMKRIGDLLAMGVTVQINYAAPSKLNLPDAQIILTPKDCGYLTPEDAAKIDTTRQ